MCIDEVRCLTRFSTLVGLYTIAGCASPTSSTPRAPIPTIPPTEPTIRDSAGSRFSSRFIYQPGQLRYRLQISSAIQLTTPDSIRRVDSTHVTGIVGVRFSTAPGRDDHVVAEVQPDSMMLFAGTGTSVPMIAGPPSTFEIDPRSGRATSSKPPQNICGADSSEQSLFSGREVLPRIQLDPVNNWVDTSATTMCRGAVLLTLMRVASYVRLESPDSSYLLFRLTRLSISGTGYQWGQRVDVAGEGIATDTLKVGGSPIRLQQLTGSSRLQLQFRAPVKVQDFVQTTMTRLFLQ